MARIQLKIWRAPLATLQASLAEGEVGIASETNTFYKRPDGAPTGALITIGGGQGVATMRAKVATTANVTLSGLANQDGIAIVAGDFILVPNQTNPAQNGLYVAASGAWTRASGADAWTNLINAIYVVEQGVTLADTIWMCTSDTGGTLGTTAVTFQSVNNKTGAVLASVTPAADALPYFTGANTAATTTLSAFARTLLDDADAAAMRTTIGAQPADAELTAIAGLSGTSGLLKKTGASTWTLDTSTYLTGNQNITVSGDASGSGTTAISLTLANSGATAGTYGNITVDAKGRVTSIAALTAANIPTLDWTKIGTGKPTTLAGYGITDAIASSAKGAANGVASLDANGLVPASQLPSYVDDVLEAAKRSSFPTTGESGKIYVALDTGKVYRWSGSVYVEIVAAPGSTDAVAEGTTNLYFTNARAQAAIAVGAPTVLNTLAKLATSINNDPSVYNTLVGLMDSKIATAVADLVGGASASASTLADLETLLVVEVNQREAADLALQASFDAFVNGGIDGGEF